MVLRANQGEAGEWVLAERRNARVHWEVSGDRQEVSMTLEPAWGGESMTVEALVAALEAQGIASKCVLTDALQSAVQSGEASAVTIARGRPPRPGQDARFEVLVTSAENLALREDEKGRVDLQHLHDFVVVEPGAPLLRRIPATEGEPGVDVYGQSIQPQAGKNASFGTPGHGAERSASESDLLVSSIRGHPVFGARTVRVDPTLRLKSVGVSSGNVEFDGSIEVAGDVASGFSVRATGDICVRGMVESASLRAGGSITVLGGVAGEEVAGPREGTHELKARLWARGDIRVKFVNLAQLKAGADLHVREYILQSRVNAGRDVLVGQPSGRGALIGGSTQAVRGVVVNQLGSEAGVSTDVTVGVVDHKRRLRGALDAEMDLCRQNLRKLETMQKRMAQGEMAPPNEDTRRRLDHTRNVLQRRRERLARISERLKRRYHDKEAARIHIRQRQYGNTLLTVEGVSRRFSAEQGAGHWQRAGSELVLQG